MCIHTLHTKVHALKYVYKLDMYRRLVFYCLYPHTVVCVCVYNVCIATRTRVCIQTPYVPSARVSLFVSTHCSVCLQCVYTRTLVCIQTPYVRRLVFHCLYPHVVVCVYNVCIRTQGCIQTPYVPCTVGSCFAVCIHTL